MEDPGRIGIDLLVLQLGQLVAVLDGEIIFLDELDFRVRKTLSTRDTTKAYSWRSPRLSEMSPTMPPILSKWPLAPLRAVGEGEGQAGEVNRLEPDYPTEAGDFRGRLLAAPQM